MRIVDTYGINGGGQIFSVELDEDRFVDVKVCPGDGPTYVMQNDDGSTVYSDKAYLGKQVDAVYPGYEYDEKAVLKLVKETLKEYGSDCMEDDGSFPLPSVLKRFREDLLSTRANIRGVTYEMGYQGWMSTFDSNLARKRGFIRRCCEKMVFLPGIFRTIFGLFVSMRWRELEKNLR